MIVTGTFVKWVVTAGTQAGLVVHLKYISFLAIAQQIEHKRLTTTTTTTKTTTNTTTTTTTTTLSDVSSIYYYWTEFV